MQPLNLPPANLKTIEREGLVQVMDPYRRKYVKLTPEEYVRQTFLSYLTHQMHFPAALTAVECMVKINGLRQRADVVVYDKQMQPLLIVECKAPSVPITQLAFNQALRYNTRLGVRFLILTNGLKHYCAEILSTGEVKMLAQMPDYNCL